MHRLLHLLHEEDEVLAPRGIGLRTEVGREGADVAAYEHTAGLALDVLLVGGQLIAWHLAQQQVAHQRAGGVGAAFGQKRAHGAVNAHHSRPAQQTVERRDVAESHQPFRRCLQLVQRQLVNQLDGAITAAVADDGLDAGVVECPADVADALGHRSGIAAIDHLAHIGAYHRLQAPAAEHVGRILHILHRRIIRRRNQRHLVASLQIVGLHAVQTHRCVGIQHDGFLVVATRGKHRLTAEDKDGGQHP